MTAFDSDVLTDLLKGVPAVMTRAAAIPTADQYVPVVAAEELLRGQLDAVRRAQAGRGPVPLDAAYAFFGQTLTGLCRVQLLPYTGPADTLFRGLRKAGIRIGTNDLRIATTCIVHGATLVTRNAQDYSQVPGLTLAVWN
ncbi:MAG: type II toxin-antitoxin system VapC family toxin [Gemmataceae bacterium]|nr:type II toxin-antitoxin system VapC family toxin [Gemmataceae bacterium]